VPTEYPNKTLNNPSFTDASRTPDSRRAPQKGQVNPSLATVGSMAQVSVIHHRTFRITDRRRERTLAANPAFKEPRASALKRRAAVRVHPIVRRFHFSLNRLAAIRLETPMPAKSTPAAKTKYVHSDASPLERSMTPRARNATPSKMMNTPLRC
jgi:hypothetical protein